MSMLDLFEVGDEVYGFCNGHFGRDNYKDKTCVMVKPTYAVFEERNGYASVLNYEEGLDKDYTNKWKEEY